MLSVLKEKASSVVSFLGNFVRDEGSQVTKVGVLQVASILAVLSIMVLPQPAAAGYPCNQCSGPCDPNQCTRDYTCYNPACDLWHMPCSGGTMYIVRCDDGGVYCNSTCPPL